MDFRKIAEHLNRLSEETADEYYIEVSVKDARKALEMLDDQFRDQFDHNGSNYYVFDDPDTAYDALLTMQELDVELLDFSDNIMGESQYDDNEAPDNTHEIVAPSDGGPDGGMSNSQPELDEAKFEKITPGVERMAQRVHDEWKSDRRMSPAHANALKDATRTLEKYHGKDWRKRLNVKEGSIESMDESSDLHNRVNALREKLDAFKATYLNEFGADNGAVGGNDNNDEVDQQELNTIQANLNQLKSAGVDIDPSKPANDPDNAAELGDKVQAAMKDPALANQVKSILQRIK